MDFFGYQDQARNRTRKLVVYFALAIVLIIVAVYLSLIVALTFAGSDWSFRLWIPELFLGVALLILLVVGTGSLYKVVALRAGGRAVAELLGAHPVNPASPNIKERRLVNVVEEMSLASGVPVPAIYLMAEEPAINAFAAGYSLSDAAVAVTQGALDQLTRDELQGVVAHEFSHILNGDMRLNIRLVGLLHGIVLLAVFGRGLLHMAFSSSRGSRRKNDAGLPLLIMGLSLLVIGAIGAIFGRLIKAAVSRQREFLADASAVQFTRNPDGLAGALRKIAASVSGSRIRNHHASEISHLFFANAVSFSFLRLFSTHPPLAERIRRIDPTFEGEIEEAGERGAEVSFSIGFSPQAGGAHGPQAQFDIRPILDSIGAPRAQHLARAQHLLGTLPERLKEAVHDPLEASALVLALLFDEDESVRNRQRDRLKSEVHSAVWEWVDEFAPLAAQLGAEYRLPLIDLALPALRRLSKQQYRELSRCMRDLISIDDEVTLFELTLEKHLEKHLAGYFESKGDVGETSESPDTLSDDVQLVLSALAHAGSSRLPEAWKSFYSASKRFTHNEMTLLPREKCEPLLVNSALERLNRIPPGEKRRLLEACTTCITHDQVVRSEELALLRVVSDAIGCPMPPV